MDSKIAQQTRLMMKCIRMALKSNICPDTDRLDLIHQIYYAHKKGYLYSNREGDLFALAYKIPEWKEEYSDVMPEEEQGDILYCGWAVSEGKNNTNLLKLFRGVPDVKELIYYKRGSNTNLKRLKVNYEK